MVRYLIEDTPLIPFLINNKPVLQTERETSKETSKEHEKEKKKSLTENKDGLLAEEKEAA